MTIKIIETGGTIDKEYNLKNGKLELPHSHIEEMLKIGKNTNKIKIKKLKLIDSLEMNENERKEILKECINSKEKKIIISHGTDTIVKTAKLIAKEKINKTVILFGAMIPFTIKNSDALFNLGSSITAVQALENNVYICMNGQIFTWDNVEKNKQKGIFQKLQKFKK